MKKDLDTKLKNEAYLRNLEDSGVKVDSLRESLKKKQNDTSEGISKQNIH